MLKKAPPPMPKIIGTREKLYPGIVLVNVEKTPKHPEFRSMNVHKIPPQTFYLFNRKTNKIEGITTKIEWLYNPLWLGWDHCGVCHSVFLHCDCRGGMSAPRSIEYVYDKELALLNGEEWDVHHPNYAGSFNKAEREARSDGLIRPVWVNDTGSRVDTVRTPYRPPIAAPKRLLTKTKSTQPAPTHKKLLTKSDLQSSNTVLKNGEVDMEALDKSATSSVEEMISHVTKRLTKTQPKKKILKRKE